MPLYEVPGQYDLDGVTYFEALPKETLDKIRTMEMYEDDVLIASYPKCGMYCLFEEGREAGGQRVWPSCEGGREGEGG